MIIKLLLLASLATLLAAQTYQPNWASLDSRPLPGWYDKAKIGIFLHWGIYSVPSWHNEWFVYHLKTEKDPNYLAFMKNYPPNFKYEDFAPEFKCELYEPNEWAEIFRKSGAKYVVLTTKHHEGYCLWPTKHSPMWNAGEVGPHRDLVGDLAKAVRTHNLTFGIYHSLLEWYNPMYMQDKANKWATHQFVTTKVRPSLEELVNNYHPSVIFSDGEWEAPDTYWNSADFLAWLYNESPVKAEVVVNDRWGSNTKCKHGGYLNCDDRFLPTTVQGRKFENCMTIDFGSWGYSREASLSRFMTINQLLEQVAKTISFGGNILINVGPRADGKIPPIFEERLTQLGEWLKVNGDAIYESHPWTTQNDPLNKEVYYTQRAGQVYGIVLGYHAEINFGAISMDSISTIHLLGAGEAALPHERIAKSGTQAHDHVLVRMPTLTPDSPAKWAYVFRFELK